MSTSKGLIFDIKRFALHDGEGVRTTVFLKGCPLKCQWCQNPEGIESIRLPVFLASECISCGLCAQHATKGQLGYHHGRPYLNYDYQGSFANVIDICPSRALRYDSFYTSIDELVAMICQDQVFFNHGGGVTFSGGEPLQQFEFLKAVLDRCQQLGINTAIETTFIAKWNQIEAILPLVDQVFVDLKLFDETMHLHYTGGSVALIKQNLTRALTGPYRDRIVVRTPLIPGITATTKNLEAIAKFLLALDPDVKYELLNYNYLASSKYRRYGREYLLDENLDRFSKDQMENFRAIAQNQGISNIIR